MQTYEKLCLHPVFRLLLLVFTLLSPAWAGDEVNPDFLPMVQRNCAPDGYEASPELYLVYYPDVLTSSKPPYPLCLFPWFSTDMLLRAMAQENVGEDRIADLVYYNFKCLDKIGHRYGVNSPEIYSYLYTVDYCLKKIKHFLDRNVGRRRYVMVVTSDHGAHNAYDKRILYRADLFNAI